MRQQTRRQGVKILSIQIDNAKATLRFYLSEPDRKPTIALRALKLEVK